VKNEETKEKELSETWKMKKLKGKNWIKHGKRRN